MPTSSDSGGRTSTKKFGDSPNSIRSTLNLPGADKDLVQKFYKNSRDYYRNFSALESWAGNGFVSGSTGSYLDEGDSYEAM